VLRKSFADKLKSHFEPILENMQALNKKNTNATPTATDVKEVLRSMLDDDELDAKMEQIPFSFLKPYGPVADAPTQGEILDKVKPVNCDWLLRPKISVSEFAEIVCSNLEILAETDSELVDV
jgi:hypothetical protein